MKERVMEQLIAVERVESDLWAFVAVNGDVQVGWCRRTRDGWWVEDMDENRLAGPFEDRDEAERVGTIELSDLGGAANPGW